MITAYILIVLGVAIWAALIPTGKSLSDSVMRAITVFGGAFLLGVCALELLPELAEAYCLQQSQGSVLQQLPFMAILLGFIVQQALESLSAHAEHGHVEGHGDGAPVLGLMIGLCLHAFLEGMPLVEADDTLNNGLLWGIIIHNIPVAIILTALLSSHQMRFVQVLVLLLLFGVMSPLGSLFNLYVVQPDDLGYSILLGLVVGVLLHVSSSILFDHKRHHFSWLNLGLAAAAFVAAWLIIQL